MSGPPSFTYVLCTCLGRRKCFESKIEKISLEENVKRIILVFGGELTAEAKKVGIIRGDNCRKPIPLQRRI